MNNYLKTLNHYRFYKISLDLQLNFKKINWHKISILSFLPQHFILKYDKYFPKIIPTPANLFDLYLKNKPEKIDFHNIDIMSDEIFEKMINFDNNKYINILIPLFNVNKISENLLDKYLYLFNGSDKIDNMNLSENILFKYFDKIKPSIFQYNNHISHNVFKKWEIFIISNHDIFFNISENKICCDVIPEKYYFDLNFRNIISISYRLNNNSLSNELKNLLFEQPETFRFGSVIRNGIPNYTCFTDLCFFNDELLIKWYDKFSSEDWDNLIKFYPFSENIIKNVNINNIIRFKIDYFIKNKNINDLILINFDDYIDWDDIFLSRNVSNELLNYLISNNKITLSVLLNYFKN